MQNVALISGLIGALISAGLSYWVRASLDKRTLQNAEKRLAYVHFVRVSELVAMDIVVTSFLKAYAGESVSSALSSADGSFEPSHKLSVLIAQEIQKLTPEKLKETPGLSTIPLLLKSQLEVLNESKLTSEQLSKLPKDAVLSYSFFLNYLSNLRGVLLLWIEVFEKKDASWITAESIHDQWLALSSFFDHAKKLRLALLVSGAATTSEASNLLQKQVSVYNEFIVSKLLHQPKLQAALTEANKDATDDSNG